MPTAVDAALAEVIGAAAPVIAAALSELDMLTTSVKFGYSTSGVRVTAVSAARLDAAVSALLPVFLAAGWDFKSQRRDGRMVCASFAPPHLLTRTDLPVADFPPR